jgi:sugar phosphate isomerase/epimerase
MKNRLILFALVSMGLMQTAHAGKASKDIFVQLYSVRDDIGRDFTGTISGVAKAGYAGVETAGYSDGKFYGLSPDAFRKAIEASGMQVLSSHTGKSLAEDIGKTDWDAVWSWWDTAIQVHKAAGMKYIVTASMPKPRTLADLKAYCDYFNRIGEKCNAAGLRFGYHNHSFEFSDIEGQMMYDYMLKNTDPSKVFFEMDVYWTVRGGQSPVDYFNNYPGRFELLHIKDNKELGQSGMVGFDAIFKNSDKAGVRYLIVEVEKYDYPPLESIKRSLDYLLDNKDVKGTYLK